MQIKLLKEIVEHIAGKLAVNIVDILFGKKDVNEFLIAKKLGLTVNQVRNLLYKLSNYGLVSFTRKKDKRKGWYIYFWTLDTLKSLELLEKKLEEEVSRLKHQLKNRETKRFYLCKGCGIEVNEEHALLNDFTCLECGQIYELSENEKIIVDLKKQIMKLRKQLVSIKEEKTKVLEKKKPKRKAKSKKKKTKKKSKKKKTKKIKKGKSKKKSVKKTKKKESGKKKTKKRIKNKKIKTKRKSKSGKKKKVKNKKQKNKKRKK